MKKCFESSIAQARACPQDVFRPIKFNFRSLRQPDLSLFYLPLQSNFPCSLLGLVANLWANQSILNPKLKEKGCPSAPIESVYEQLNLPRVWSALVRLPPVLAFLFVFIGIVLIILGVSWVFNNNDNNNNIVRAKNSTHFQGNCCLTVGT